MNNNQPYIAQRFASHFLVTRPPLPWQIADQLSICLNEAGIDSLGITGSIHPSIIIAAAYGMPRRKINAYASSGPWSEFTSWNYMISDSLPEMEETHPYANECLPIADNQFHLWDGGTPFINSQALFIDLPFAHPLVNISLDHLKNRDRKLLFLGFMEDHDGPNDVHEWALGDGYEFEEATRFLYNHEKSKRLQYKFLIGRHPSQSIISQSGNQ